MKREAETNELAMTAKCFFLFVSLLILGLSTPAEKSWWKVQTSGIDTNLRGVSVAHDKSARDTPVWAVWTSGSNGVILESNDQGKTWVRLHVEGGEALDFRGIVAFSAAKAYVMSSGEGEKSRIYKTTDGGKTWKLQYSDTRKEFFLDTIACRSEKDCVALGDPIGGKFLLLRTSDGEHWNPLPTDNMPIALGGEGAFAASNSCLTLSGEKEVFLATGGPAARVFHSTDRGLTWTLARTPVLQGNPSSGAFSVGFDGDKHLIVVGGDYKAIENPDRVSAYSTDSGLTWQLAARQPSGFRSAVAHVHDGYWVAIGPTGEDITNDGGIHWKHTDSLNLNAVAVLDSGNGWAVGARGTIARLVNHFK